MEDQIDKIVDMLNELETDDQSDLLCSLVATFLEAITDCKVDALYELSVFNHTVASLISDDDGSLH